MFLDIHLSERANVADSGNIDREISIKVDNISRFAPQCEAQNKRRNNWTEQLLGKKRLQVNQINNVNAFIATS